jgi:hypothetical protein
LIKDPVYEKWTIKELATPYYGTVSGDSAKALTLPKYQRNFVWSDKKRKELIDSIRQGFPIGTLIVRRVGSKTNIKRDGQEPIEADTFELLDGLQRSTTLLLHRLNFVELLDEKDVNLILNSIGVDVAKLEQACVEAGTITPHETSASKVIATWLRSCSVPTEFEFGQIHKTTYTVNVFDEHKFQILDLLSSLAENWGTNVIELKQVLENQGVYSSFVKFPGETRAVFDIGNKKIPVIVWEGSDEGAASIFERVNQGGVKLNRYQSLAASWYKSVTNVKAGSELGVLAHSALSTPSGGAVVEKQTRNADNLDLYECLVGLSEMLARDFPHIFSPAAKPVKESAGSSPLEKQGVNYYAFNVTALVLKLKISDLVRIRTKLEEHSVGEEIDFSTISKAIYLAAEKIAEALKCLNYANKDYSNGHTEAAIAAMVASLTLHTLEGKSVSKVSEIQIRQHYLLDLLTGLDAKGHATDIAAFDRVWVAESDDFRPSDRYTKPCPMDELEQALDSYWTKEQQKTISPDQALRPRIDNIQKSVLRLYLASKANYTIITSSSEHHIDHVIPFKKGKTWVKNSAESVFIGAITNLAFLPPKLNLSKGELTLDEWLDGKPNLKNKSVKDEILSNFTVEDIWSLVAAEPGESKDLDRFQIGKSKSQIYSEIQESIWLRMKERFLKTN